MRCVTTGQDKFPNSIVLSLSHDIILFWCFVLWWRFQVTLFLIHFLFVLFYLYIPFFRQIGEKMDTFFTAAKWCEWVMSPLGGLPASSDWISFRPSFCPSLLFCGIVRWMMCLRNPRGSSNRWPINQTE